MERIMVRKISFKLIVIVFVLFISIPPVYSKNIITLAVLPFQTHSEQDITHIQSGILNMLHSRLAWKDHVSLIHKNETRQKLAAMTYESENELVSKLGHSNWTDYVLTGSITEYANAFSLDIKIYNIDDQSYLTFYDQTPTIDQVIEKVDVISAKINKRVFGRTTAAFERMKKKEIISEEQLKRMNPEQMMPYRERMNQKDKPWWKFW